MSLATIYRHDQFTLVSLTVCLLIFAVLFGCHLTQPQKKDIITTTAIVAEAVATGTPIPWTEIGIAISTIIGSGVFIDNRRKDVLIKRLKTENANALELVTKLVAPNGANLSRDPPQRTN